MAYPAWAGVIVVFGLSIILFGFLYILLRLNKYWAQYVDKVIAEALLKRRHSHDDFRELYGYSWDYVIAFKVYEEDEEVNDEQIKFSMKYVLQQLAAGNLQFRLFYSGQRKEVYCKIRATPQRLYQEADRIDMKLIFDEEKLKRFCGGGMKDNTGNWVWEPLQLPDISKQTSIPPYRFIYCKVEYDSVISDVRQDLLNLYKQWPMNVHNSSIKGNDTFSVESPLKLSDSTIQNTTNDNTIRYSIFRAVDRLKLIHSIIESKAKGCSGIDIYKLVRTNAILAYFPLHDIVELRSLESKWMHFFQAPWRQEVDLVKDYFGEKIGLYFAWIGFYTTYLIPAALFGFISWAVIASENNNPNSSVVPYFAGFMALWSALFLEYWKRLESEISMKWGMEGFEATEQVRPQFIGVPAKSPIDGKEYLYYSKFERVKKSLQSNFAIGGFILIVLSTITIIFLIRVILNKANAAIGGQSISGVVSSILLAIQIQIFNAIYGEFAIFLNDRENHRTDTEYEDALITKTFMFQFVNSYFSLFYISFVKPFIPDIDSCPNRDCMLELQTTLGTIFLTRLTVGNFFELVVPILKSSWNSYQRQNVLKNTTSHDVLVQESSNEAHEMSEVEKVFMMPNYDVMLGSFEDYAEMIIQFGYSTMFVSAFPLATVMSLVNNYVEIRVDTWKICHLTKRPEPRSCEDIGTWYIILEAISFSAVFVNSALVAFTGAQTLNYTWVERVWFFCLMSAGLAGIRLLVAYLVPDVPSEVEIQLKRQDYIVDKVLHNVPDEGQDQVTSIARLPMYCVLSTDDDPL